MEHGDDNSQCLSKHFFWALFKCFTYTVSLLATPTALVYRCCCDKIPFKSNLGETGFIVGNNSRLQSISERKAQYQELKTTLPITSTVQSRKKWRHAPSAPFFCTYNSGPQTMESCPSPLSSSVLPHQLRKSRLSPADVPTGQPDLDHTSLKIFPPSESRLCQVSLVNN